MFLRERQDKISEFVNTNGRATVIELSEKFGVTEDCIRKDLKHLDAQGLLKRVYGGAISTSVQPNWNISTRINTKIPEKRAIAEKAYGLIDSGETIYLDISTTNIALAEKIAAGTKYLTVVTNMIDILQALNGNPAIKVISTGGTVNYELNSFYGSAAIQMLESYHFDKVFMGAIGINLDAGELLTYDIDDGAVKRQVSKTASQVILVADSEKFSSSGSYTFAHFDDITTVITDKMSDKLKEQLSAFDITYR